MTTPPTRGNVLTGAICLIGAASIFQAVVMIGRLANISDFPPAQWGQIQISTNLYIVLSGITIMALLGMWSWSRQAYYGLYGLGMANLALSLYAEQPAVALITALLMSLLFIITKDRRQLFT